MREQPLEREPDHERGCADSENADGDSRVIRRLAFVRGGERAEPRSDDDLEEQGREREKRRSWKSLADHVDHRWPLLIAASEIDVQQPELSTGEVLFFRCGG